jgi:hypothetical protein
MYLIPASYSKYRFSFLFSDLLQQDCPVELEVHAHTHSIIPFSASCTYASQITDLNSEADQMGLVPDMCYLEPNRITIQVVGTSMESEHRLSRRDTKKAGVDRDREPVR